MSKVLTIDECREVAQAVIDRMDHAWHHEGGVPADILTEDAIYTNIPGMSFRGRAAIVAGTREVRSKYKVDVTKKEMEEVRRLADTTLLALVKSYSRVPEGPRKGDHKAYQVFVIVWDTDSWRIAAYQATGTTE